MSPEVLNKSHVKPPEEDFGYDEYFQIFLEDLKNQLANKNIEQEEFQKILADMIDVNNNRNAPLNQLPGYNVFKQTWASRLPIFLNTDYHEAPSGMIYDKSGSAVDPVVARKMYSNYYAVKSSAMDEGERADLDEKIRQFNDNMAFNQQQFAYQQQQDVFTRERQAQQDILEARGQTTEQAYRQANLGLQREQFGWQKEIEARQLEQQRQETLAQLQSQPKSWIQAFMFEHPTPPPQLSPIERNAETINILGQRGSELLRQAQRAEGNPEVADLSTPYYPDAWRSTPEQRYDMWNANMQALYEAQAIQKEYQNIASQGGWDYLQTPRQTTPNAPEWLPALVPGLAPGAPITQQRARVASPQQWATIAPTQREMLGGYLEYASPAGYPTLSDYENMIQRMLPQPTGSQNWRPALQR